MLPALAVFLIIHGLAHFIVFLVKWEFIGNDESRLNTTFFFGKTDIGKEGTKIAGFLFLLTSVAFLSLGYCILWGAGNWYPAIWYASTFSTILCLSGWPDTKFGVFANALLLAFLLGFSLVSNAI